MPEQRITFTTAFYPVRSKFPSQKYIQWTTQFFSIVRQFYLVVFTDEATQQTLLEIAQGNPNIRIVVRPLYAFHGMKYAEFWEENHCKNFLLKTTCWELNMLWNEKVWFVGDVIQNLYFPETEYYGWVDIGYFRNENNNIHTFELTNWANYDRLVSFSPKKVHYTMVNPIGFRLIQKLHSSGLGIPLKQTTVAGGFFLGGKEPLLQWRDIFKEKLEQYVSVGSLLRDDQIIVVECLLDMGENGLIVLHEGRGKNCSCHKCNHTQMVDTLYRHNLLIHYENDSPFPLSCCHTEGIDDWFLFQKLLV